MQLVSVQEPSNSFGPFTVQLAPKGSVQLVCSGATVQLTGPRKLDLVAEVNLTDDTTMFQVQEQAGGVYTLCNLRYTSYLTSFNGRLTAAPSSGPEAQFNISEPSVSPANGLDSSAALGGPPRLDWDPSFTLTPVQQQAFVEQGFIHLEQLVNAQLVSEAVRIINAGLCTQGAVGRNPNTTVTSLSSLVGSDSVCRFSIVQLRASLRPFLIYSTQHPVRLKQYLFTELISQAPQPL